SFHARAPLPRTRGPAGARGTPVPAGIARPPLRGLPGEAAIVDTLEHEPRSQRRADDFHAQLDRPGHPSAEPGGIPRGEEYGWGRRLARTAWPPCWGRCWPRQAWSWRPSRSSRPASGGCCAWSWTPRAESTWTWSAR